MSKSDFLQSVRVARNLFVHRVTTDHPGLDPDEVEGQLARAAIWLTPSAVNGFDIREFGELPAERRRELQDSVEQFLRVARQVPGNKPATLEQVRDGMTAIRRALEVLRPYLPDPSETRRIREVLERVHFPDFVVNWNFEVGEDSTGDPAVWVHVFVKDEVIGKPNLIVETTEIERRIRLAFAEKDMARWPFVRFRTASEQRSLENIAS